MTTSDIRERDLTERWGRGIPGRIDFRVATTRLGRGATTGCRSNSEEQVLMVVEGRAEAFVGDVQARLEQGSSVVIPATVCHEIHNIGDEPLALVSAFADDVVPDQRAA
jgi:mannose-6-phosphate isomerase-like protein (cupin superfamily)